MVEDSWEMVVDPASRLSALAVSSHLVVNQNHLQQEMNGHGDTMYKKREAGNLQMCC